jgi:hypothetical protein
MKCRTWDSVSLGREALAVAANLHRKMANVKGRATVILNSTGGVLTIRESHYIL